MGNKFKAKRAYFSRWGYEHLFLSLLSKIIFFADFRLFSLLDKRRQILARECFEKYRGTVQNGAYQGLLLSGAAGWSAGDLGNQLLGCYEKEVQDEISELQQGHHFERLIVFGAGDGFHTIGCIKKLGFKQAVAYEMNKKSRQILSENAALNGLAGQVEIKGAIDKKGLAQLLETAPQRSLFLIDLEGFETELLLGDTIERIKQLNSGLVIEIHDFTPAMRQKAEALKERLKARFECKSIKTAERKMAFDDFFNSYSDLDRHLIISEDRPSLGKWISCV